MKRLLVIAAWVLVAAVYLALGWIPGTLLLLVALASSLRALARTARALAPFLQCPHGHPVPTYGLVRCSACGFTSEGLVWRCRHCGTRYGHTPCPTCGLSVRNPAL